VPAASRLPALLADQRLATGTLVLTGGRLFDGTGSAMRDAVSVVVRDGRVEAVVAAGDGIPADAAVLDLAGRTLLPGLIDAHAHLTMTGHSQALAAPRKGAEPYDPALPGHLAAATLRRALRMGITTVRDVGAYGDTLFGVRQAMRYGAFTGPRLLVCGRIVSATAPGDRFFPGMYRQADGPDDVRRAVREQIRAGADFVKIMTTGARTVELEDPHPAQVTREELATLVDEAHRLGFRVAAHCEGLPGTELAVEEGVDTIEHGMHLHRRPDLLEQLAARGGVLVPTLSFLHHVAEDGCWVELLEEQGAENVAAAHETLGAARRAGVRLAMGFDSPDVDRAASELVRMVEHGLPPHEALAAATSGGAYALGIDDQVGVVANGRLADLLVVDGDPVSEPGVLLDPARIWLVLRNGAPVAGAVLEASPPVAVAEHAGTR
jgi:imidazolonepropionase-like amidohydrolase